MTNQGGGGMRIRLLKRGRVVKSYKVKPDTFTIGSGKEATIRAGGVDGLAPKHALVWLDDGIPTLVPSAGCVVMVNGAEVQFARLAPSDVVTIGKLELQIAAADAEGDVPAAAPPQAAPAPRAAPRVPHGPDDDGPTMIDTLPTDPRSGSPARAGGYPAPGRPPAPPQAPPPAVSPQPSVSGFAETFLPPQAPPPAARRPPVHSDFDEDGETLVARPVVSAGPAARSGPVVAARPAPVPQVHLEHKPTALGVPLARVPAAAPAAEEPRTIEVEHKRTALGRPLQPAVEARGFAAPPTAAPPPQRLAPPMAPALEPEPALSSDWDRDEDDDDDELSFVEPFSLVEHIERAGSPDRSGPRERYVVAQVTRHSGGKLWRVVTVGAGGEYRPDPSGPPLLRMTRDGRCILSVGPQVVGRLRVGEQETPASAFQTAAGQGGQATLSDGDRAVLDAPEGRFVVQVLRPPRAARPGLLASIVALGVLLLYGVGVLGILGGSAFALQPFYVPDPTPAGGAEEEQYELISQNDLTLIAPQNMDAPEEQPVEAEESDQEVDPREQEVPPETIPRTTRRVRPTKSTSGSSAAAQLISALSSSGGGGGASLRDVITNIDAVGSASAGSALFRTTGVISSLPGGDVKVARRGGAGGVATLGGDALKAASPGLGGLKSSGRAGAVRGSVSRVSSLMRVQGSLDRGEVLRVINRHIGAITQCYERRLLANPTLAGRIVYSWNVTESGGVSGVSVRSSTLEDAQVATCISRVIGRMRFPRPEGGAVSISFPFVFRAVE